jgi:hypothetical protein
MRSLGPWRFDPGTRQVMAENDDTVADVWNPADGPVLAAASEYHEAVGAILKAWAGGALLDIRDAVYRLQDVYNRTEGKS